MPQIKRLRSPQMLWKPNLEGSGICWGRSRIKAKKKQVLHFFLKAPPCAGPPRLKRPWGSLNKIPTRPVAAVASLCLPEKQCKQPLSHRDNRPQSSPPGPLLSPWGCLGGCPEPQALSWACPPSSPGPSRPVFLVS